MSVTQYKAFATSSVTSPLFEIAFRRFMLDAVASRTFQPQLGAGTDSLEIHFSAVTMMHIQVHVAKDLVGRPCDDGMGCSGLRADIGTAADNGRRGIGAARPERGASHSRHRLRQRKDYGGNCRPRPTRDSPWRRSVARDDRIRIGSL